MPTAFVLSIAALLARITNRVGRMMSAEGMWRSACWRHPDAPDGDAPWVADDPAVDTAHDSAHSRAFPVGVVSTSMACSVVPALGARTR